MKKNEKKTNSTEKKQLSLKLRLFLWTIDLFLILLIGIATYILIIFFQMPSLDSFLHETRPAAIIYLDKNGNEIHSSNQIMGSPVSVDTLPPYVWQSIIAIEDKRFFEHGPIDPRSLLRAIFSNLGHGKLAIGGSTITQQTAKNIFLSRDKKISRKIQEFILSYWLENRFNKKQILDLYMNRVYLVADMRGIDAAAKKMFNKSAKNLSLAQSTQIAAMLKAPTTYSPLKNPQNNIKRAKIILKELVRQKYISENEAKQAAKELAAATPKSNTNIYRYWTDFVSDEILSRLGIIQSDIYIHTTLDTELQKHIATTLQSNTNNYQTAVIAMSYDGAIKSMIGGTNYQQSQFNRTLALRQPGSTFKPIVYLVALENGMTPDSIVKDQPFSIGDYTPKNYNEHYYGEISLATAFAKSVNSVPLQLTKQYGIDSVLNMAARLGIGNKLHREYSTILGASEISLLDLTTIYSVIWNNGQSVKPYSITKITDVHGNILYNRQPSVPIQILSEQTVNYMSELLANVVQPNGTGHNAMAENVIGGKTGTSNDNRDAWFIGATQSTIVGIWVGNDDFSPMGNKITGGTIPAKIFHDIVSE